MIENQKENSAALENFFYHCSFEKAHTFGISLWAYAYKECQNLWKERQLIFKEDSPFFPFILNVQASSGFIFLGMRLGLKYFLYEKDFEIFTKLQNLVRQQGGELFSL
ncbi:MAG: hypothetical protein JSS34_07925 [Proteobacteria bacterium]|nr:hypothetical protein [Pseudomonadota bacterium]